VPIGAPEQVPSVLAGLKGRIDWLWMVPDLTVLTPQTVDYLMLFSLESRVPIFTFARKYLDMGAALSASIDPYDMGRQAGEMALALLRGTSVAELPQQAARKVVVEVNDTAAKMLGVAIVQPSEQEP
jgi:putative ABC transport system substrate-binding protein